MSHATAKSAGTGQPSLDELVNFGFKLLTQSIDNARIVMQQASNLIGPMPQLPSLRPRDMCEIPETECPPRCVCDVKWDASPDETMSLVIRVKNDSKSDRTFQLNATPFTGAGGSPGTITMTPNSLTLPSRHAGISKATFKVLKVPEGDYDAEIVIKGAYEQCVRVRLRVNFTKTCGEEECLCDVLQGEPPERIRAHRWYDHFQCVEKCDEATPHSHNGGNGHNG
jgi:hypothetical protein